MGRDVSRSHLDETTDVGSEASPGGQLSYGPNSSVHAYISPWSLADGISDIGDWTHQAVHHAPNECSHNGIAEPCSDRSTELIQSELRLKYEVVKTLTANAEPEPKKSPVLSRQHSPYCDGEALRYVPDRTGNSNHTDHSRFLAISACPSLYHTRLTKSLRVP